MTNKLIDEFYLFELAKKGEVSVKSHEKELEKDTPLSHKEHEDL